MILKKIPGDRMNNGKIKEAYAKYYIADWIEIGSNLLFFVLSFIPALGSKEEHQMSVAMFFLVISIAELILYFWEHGPKKKGSTVRAQAGMLLVTGDILLLMQTVSIIAIMYEMRIKDDTPLMASNLFLAISYGIFAIWRMVTGIHRIIKNGKKDAYQAALSGVMMVCAVYTFSLFVDYMLIVNNAANYIWPRYFMIAYMGATTLLLAIWMQIKAINILKNGWMSASEPDQK